MVGLKEGHIGLSSCCTINCSSFLCMIMIVSCKCQSTEHNLMVDTYITNQENNESIQDAFQGCCKLEMM